MSQTDATSLVIGDGTGTSAIQPNLHKLYNAWTLWAHLPHDTDWTVKSYKQIYTVESVEGTIALCETIPEKMGDHMGFGLTHSAPYGVVTSHRFPV